MNVSLPTVDTSWFAAAFGVGPIPTSQRKGSAEQLALARKAADTAKIALGERGPVWWTDGAPDMNRHKVSGSPYAEWWAKE